MSKGDKRRPGDEEAFASNFESIFGSRKSVRGTYVQDPETGKLVPKDEFYATSPIDAPMVMGDIQPYKSMATGEVIEGRRQHREHLKSHGLIEVGNETKHISQNKKRDDPRLKQRIIDIVNHYHR